MASHNSVSALNRFNDRVDRTSRINASTSSPDYGNTHISGKTSYSGAGGWFQSGTNAEMYKDYYYTIESSITGTLCHRFFQAGGAGIGFAASHNDVTGEDYIYVIGAGGNGNSSTPSTGNNTLYYYKLGDPTFEGRIYIPRNLGTIIDPYGGKTNTNNILERQYNNAGYVNYCCFNDEHGNILIAQCDDSYNLKAFIVLPRGCNVDDDCVSTSSGTTGAGTYKAGTINHYLRFSIEPDDVQYNTAAKKAVWATNNPRLNILSHLDVRHLELRAFHDCWDFIGYVMITIPGTQYYYRLRLNGQDSDIPLPSAGNANGTGAISYNGKSYWYVPGTTYKDKKWNVFLSDIEEHSPTMDDVENVNFYYVNPNASATGAKPTTNTFTNACTVSYYSRNRYFLHYINEGMYWLDNITNGGYQQNATYNPNWNATSPAKDTNGNTGGFINTMSAAATHKVTNTDAVNDAPGATAFLLQGGSFAVFSTGGTYNRRIRIQPHEGQTLYNSATGTASATFDGVLLSNSARTQNFASGNAGTNGANIPDYSTYTIAKPASGASYTGVHWYRSTADGGAMTGTVGNNNPASSLTSAVYTQILHVDYRTVDVFFYSRNVGFGKIRVTADPKPLTNGRGYGHFSGRHRIQWDCPGTRGCYGYRVEVKVGTGSYTTLYGSTDSNLWTPTAHNSVNTAGSKTYADVTFDDSNASRLGKNCTYRITPVYKTMGWNGESIDWANFILEDGPSIEIPVTVPVLPTPTTSVSISTVTGATTANPGSDLKQVDASLTVTRPSGSWTTQLPYPTYYQHQVSKASGFGTTIESNTATISASSASYTKSNIAALGNLDVTSTTTGTNTITKTFTYYSRARARYNYNPGDSLEQVWGNYGTVASKTLSLTFTAPTVTAYNFVDAARRVEEWWGSGASGHKVTQYYDVYRIGLQIANISGNSVQPSYYTLQRRQSSSSAWENVTDQTYEYLCGTGSQATYPSISGYTAGRYKGNYTFSNNRYTMTVDGNSRSVNVDYFYWFNVTSVHTNSASDPSQSNPNEWQYRIVADYASSNSKLAATLEGPASAVSTPIVTAVDSTTQSKEIRDTKYYNLQGVMLQESPISGAFIEVTLYSDGTISTAKRVARR
ncbi:MAG: hypothetical protein IK120_08155 [Muribaculaceae bacterium]|nr:hypothetical protein [Muribaculaceae bacterium]